ncbi:MAG: ASKHA domain-containing protein [Candidatus Bathyarchaeota archaeon]|nr:ASKHA domain-containing protein [Candidatus Bathyarchaeota archaeon]
MGNLVKIVFNPMNREIEVERGRLLLDAIREADIRIESICGGKGECGKCRVILNQGDVSSLSTSQKKHLSPQEIAEGYRLACQIRVLGDSEFTIPVESRIDRPKILLSMEMAMDRLDPASKKYLMKVAPFRDYEQMLLHRAVKLEGYAGPTPRMDHQVYDKLLSMEQEEPVTVTLTRTNNYPEIINVESGNRTRSNYGLAIDVGTTTIAILLVDLTSGKVLGRESGLNRQITYGEELIPRIAFAGEPNGLQKLQTEVAQSINDIVDHLTSRIGVENDEIADICAGGNTVMNHLLAGMDPTYLNMANVEVSRRPIILEVKAVGIHANPDAYVYCLPNVSRFLGGDAVGDVIASGMYDSDEISLTVDMGTNGEIIFGNKSWLVSCSCASGPAFEGEGIKFGIRAMRGGIEHVKIDPESFESEYTVIGGTLPKGICGSGIIDLAAEMFSVGILDFAGKIVKGRTPLVRKGRDGLEYVVVPAEKTAIGRDIVITQRDMDYVMDSKAAACGAITVLMKKLKLSIYDVQNLYLAGAFGAYTDLSNATKLGIFPEFPKAKIHPIGNGSLSGAYATLLSVENREKARAIAENMVYIDLLVDVEFTERYSEAIYIPGKKEFFPSYSS